MNFETGFESGPFIERARTAYQTNDTQFFENWLRPRLSEKRFFHSQGVASCAVALAQQFGLDEIVQQKVFLAGLLHDCCKLLNKQQLMALVDTFEIELSTEDKLAPQTLHALVGAKVVQHDLGIDDSDILEAIKSHTIGKAAMGWPELIVYVADKIEPNTRDPKFINLVKSQFDETNNPINLLKAGVFILNDTIAYLTQENQRIHPRTVDARNDLMARLTLAQNSFEFSLNSVDNHRNNTIGG